MQANANKRAQTQTNADARLSESDVTCGVFARYFFVALFCLEKQCSGLFRYFFVDFSWLFRGPRFGQILRVLSLEQSSD